jgi:hypothetical protein
VRFPIIPAQFPYKLALIAFRTKTNIILYPTGYLQAAKRWGNFFTCKTGGLGAYKHYLEMSRAMMTRGKAVNAEGAK